MNRFLLPLLLLSALPLMANDEGGDGPYIPNYQQLVREGYGTVPTYYTVGPSGIKSAPKPTQAFYGNGYTIYYGYTPVPTHTPQVNLYYAFGYPVDYFRQMMPTNITEANMDRYAVEVISPRGQQLPAGNNEAGTMVAKQGTTTVRPTAVASTTTTAKQKASTLATTGTNTLPPIGEKPSH